MGNSAQPSATNFSNFVLPSPLTDEAVVAMMGEFGQYNIIDPKYVNKLIDGVCSLVESKPSVCDLDIDPDTSVTVVGDLHGQYFDLQKIFEMNGNPSKSNRYLFNGDFVDRGAFGVEVVLTLFAWKLLYPEHVTLLRGNHEIRSVNETYGFKDEVVLKYGSERLFYKLNTAFTKLPIAGVLKNKVFVVHGGLPRQDGGQVSLDAIRSLPNDMEPKERSILSDLLWSDPQDDFGVSMSPRNVGILFGPDVTLRFLHANNLDLVVRSHELCADGYRIQEGGKVVTIFSAPNYCGRCGNLAAFARFDSELKMTIRQFPATIRPPAAGLKKPASSPVPVDINNRRSSFNRYMGDNGAAT